MTAGAPLGIRRNNPGNIEYNPAVPWQGQVEPHDGHRFAAFYAPEWGIRAIARVLITYQDKRLAADGSPIDTVADFIARWAPPGENDTDSYARHMRQLLHVAPGQVISVHGYETCRRLVMGIIEHENGFCPYEPAVISRGLLLAGVEPPETIYQLFKPEPKPVAKSRTMQGGLTAGIAAGGSGALSMVDWFWGRLGDQPLLQFLLGLMVVIGVGVMLYGYWRARQEGRVDVPTVAGL